MALEKRFVHTQEPRDLTLIFAAAPGDGKSRGINRLAHEGLVKRAIGGHWALVPQLAKLATENRIEAYNLPLGTISHLYRDAAAHRAGTLSKVGLGTFVDPRLGGGRINLRTQEELVRVMEIDGEEWLFYKVFPINVALIRGTTADPSGNITMEHEALLLDAQAAAMAARNANGLVIAQVERIAANGTLDARSVVVPGVLVDCVVVAAPEFHQQTYGTAYNAAYAGALRVPANEIAIAPLDERKLIARRCAFELPLGGVINLGIGMPEVLGAVAAEERVLEHLTLTTEPGVIGGMPQGGLDFGAAVNTQALLHQNQQFDFYDGGGLDLACLGMAQTDRAGNVNVSRFGSRLAGSGGFINISQNARRVVFAGTFTAGGLEVAIEDGRLRIVTRRTLAEVRRSSRADHFQRSASGAEAAVGALRDRTLRLRAAGRRPATDRGGARHRHRTRHPGAHGVPALDRRSEAHGCSPLRCRPDGALGRVARSAAHRTIELRRAPATSCSSTSRAMRSATWTMSTACDGCSRHAASKPGARSRWSPTTTVSTSTRRSAAAISRWSRICTPSITTPRRATPPAPSCA